LTDPPAVPASRAAPRLAGGVRTVAHLVVWASVLVPALVELSIGWRPFGDDAAISSRAYQVLSSHGSLTGLASAASNHTGHEVYGLGPLLFYLLALPVRIDPAHGLLWGAAVVCGVVLSLAVEAAWATGRWLACGLLALAVLDLLWRTPFVFDNIGWNASLPVPFLLASVLFAWLVANGETGWWPVLVVTASVTAQCHLYFTIPAALLVIVALVLGLLHPARRGRLRWIPVGLGLGLLCWLAPIVQQLEGPRGNFSAVLHAAQGQQELGITFALRDLAMAGAAHPLWLVRLPTGFFPLAGLETAHPAWYGVVLLGLLAVVAGVGWGTGRRALGGFAAVTLALAGGLVIGLTVFPANEILSLSYLVDAFWLVAMALWVLLAWVVVEAVGVATARAPAAARGGVTRLAGAAGPLGVVAFVLGLLVLGTLEVRAAGTDPPKVEWSSADVAVVARAAGAIEQAIPPGPVSVVAVGTDFYTSTWSEEGVVFRLEYDGWIPGTQGAAALYLGLHAPKGAPTYVVTMRGARVTSVRRLVLP